MDQSSGDGARYQIPQWAGTQFRKRQEARPDAVLAMAGGRGRECEGSTIGLLDAVRDELRSDPAHDCSNPSGDGDEHKQREEGPATIP